MNRKASARLLPCQRGKVALWKMVGFHGTARPSLETSQAALGAPDISLHADLSAAQKTSSCAVPGFHGQEMHSLRDGQVCINF